MESFLSIIYEGTDTGYKVSNLGRIKNKHNKFLTPYPVGNGYPAIKLVVGGSARSFYVHSLVMCVFSKFPLELYMENRKLMVNHKDGKILNNNYANLEFCTGSQNAFHAVKNGLTKAKRYVSKAGRGCYFDDVTVAAMRSMRQKTSLSQQVIAKIFGTTQPTVARICNYTRRAI